MPPWLALLGAILMLVLAFGFIFFVASSCVASQESKEVRTYVTSSRSTLSDSATVGNEEVQVQAGGALQDPPEVNVEALNAAADRVQQDYLGELRNEEVPPEFEEAHHYMVSALGIRASATRELADAARGDRAGLGEAVSRAAESYKVSDALVRDNYVPASREALRASGRRSDQNYLYEPKAFMDYEQLGLAGQEGGGGSAAAGDPNALRGVEVFAVEVAGQPLYAGGQVVLAGEDEPVFEVTVRNGGEVAETGVPVEVVLNTSAERQSQSATTARIEPVGAATVQVRGFRPGELEETAEVTITVGPVEGEKTADNNTLIGTVTFGI